MNGRQNNQRRDMAYFGSRQRSFILPVSMMSIIVALSLERIYVSIIKTIRPQSSLTNYVINKVKNNSSQEETTSTIPMMWNVTTWNIISQNLITSQNRNHEVLLVNDIIEQIYPDKRPIKGTIGSNGKLIVDLKQNSSKAFVMFPYGPPRLCELFRIMTLEQHVPMKKDGNQSLDTVLIEHYNGVQLTNRPLLNLTLDCNTASSGNMITAMYNTRMMAAAARVDLQMQCSDGNESKTTQLLPWFTTTQNAPTVDNPWPFKGRMPYYHEVCGDYKHFRIDFMIDEIINDVQKLAVEVMGSRGMKMTHHLVPIDQPPPLVPNITVEDAVIHFRCGDMMGVARRHEFGLMKFTEYKKWLAEDTKTIGIVTQSFDKSKTRKQDSRKVESCRQATKLLVDTLQDFYPSAVIYIHNDENETLPLTYARLAMANQSFASLSSFGIFPVIGGFGKGYFQKGNDLMNPFNIHLPKMYPEKLHMMEGEILSSKKMRGMKLDAILRWLSGREELEGAMTQ